MITNIKVAREKAEMLQRDCADALGITLRAWQNYEHGEREPKFELLCSIAELFNVTTDYLLGRDTGEPTAADKLAVEFNMTALERKILDNYLALPKQMRGDLMEFLQKSVKEIQENNE